MARPTLDWQNRQRLIRDLVELAVRHGGTLKLGNVIFLVDKDGPYAGKLKCDIDYACWDCESIASDFVLLWEK